MKAVPVATPTGHRPAGAYRRRDASAAPGTFAPDRDGRSGPAAIQAARARWRLIDSW